MKQFALIIALMLCSARAFGTSYYIANAGNNANPCTIGSPCQTIGKLNALLLTANPGDNFYLNRGDTFRDAYIFCGSQYNSSVSPTIVCGGTALNPITIGAYGTGPKPYIDAADVLTGLWTLYAGTTWKITIPAGSAAPLKLYLDPSTANLYGQQLLPVINETGACATGVTYYALDACDNSSGQQVVQTFPTPVTCPTTACAVVSFQTLPSPPCPSSCTPATYQARQYFGMTGNADFPAKTGIQNVTGGLSALIPDLPGLGYPTYQGAWYYTGTASAGYTIYLNLADGSSPNSHVIEATHRNYGVEIEGTNWVIVQDLMIGHAYESGALNFAYSDTDAVANNVTFQRLNVFNSCNINDDSLTKQQSTNGDGFTACAGITQKSSGSRNPPNLQNSFTVNNTVGTIDNWFDVGPLAGIYHSGVQGDMISGNFVNTTNSAGIVRAAALNYAPTTLPQSVGGLISNNEVTNSQSNIQGGNTAGGTIQGNYIHESHGQGLQIGGYSSSVDGGKGTPVAGSFVVTQNVIANLSPDASLNLYNGIDCNTNSTIFQHFYETNNTIINTWGAGATFEGSGSAGNGCQAPYFSNNVIDMKYLAFGNQNKVPTWTPGSQGMNGGCAFYYVRTNHVGYIFNNNLYRLGSGTYIGCNSAHSSETASCANWLSGAPDTSTSCTGVDPLFANPSAGNFRMQAASPLRTAGAGGTFIGAYAYAPLFFFQGTPLLQGFHKFQ